MTANKILTILLVCICTSQAWAKPVDHFKNFDVCKLKSSYKLWAPAETDKQLSPTIQLMKVIVFDLQEMALSYVAKSKEISDQVLKDSTFNSNTSPEVLKFKKDLEEFESRYISCSDMPQLFDLMEFYSNTTADYYEPDEEDSLKPETKVIVDVLKKYSPQDFNEEFEKNFLNAFVINFGNKFEEVKDALKKEEGMGEKVFKWWENVKSLKTADDKLEAFMDYVKMYGFVEDASNEDA